MEYNKCNTTIELVDLALLVREISWSNMLSLWKSVKMICRWNFTFKW